MSLKTKKYKLYKVVLTTKQSTDDQKYLTERMCVTELYEMQTENVNSLNMKFKKLGEL